MGIMCRPTSSGWTGPRPRPRRQYDVDHNSEGAFLDIDLGARAPRELDLLRPMSPFDVDICAGVGVIIFVCLDSSILAEAHRLCRIGTFCAEASIYGPMLLYCACEGFLGLAIVHTYKY